MLPSIFGDNLFDDWMGFPFPSFENMDRRLYGRHADHIMKTDVKEVGTDYEVAVDLPGFKKDQVQLQLENGYLTITASKEMDEEKKQGHKIIRQERYAGSMQRSFYVGEDLTADEVKAKFEDGVLTLTFPKKEARQIPEHKTIMIEG
ncbi:MAG: Hsp20/alpha crystallin family protein [Oscillibacter sp.]|nr:Hsp20/alpha crystallin family protein [Oscillibacter sp.]